MNSNHSKDEMIGSENEGLKIKIENCISEEENKDLINAFDAAQGFESQIGSADCTSNLNLGEGSDSEDNYCIVKTEAEILQINEVTPYTCEICSATYDGLASYEVHIEEKHGMHNIIHTEASRHKRIHTGEKPYKCDECTLSFIRRGKLERHKRTHTGEKPYKCDECTSTFTTSDNLKRHQWRHTGEKPYKCDECTSSYTTRDNLKNHKRIHTGEKPYKCDECTSSYTTRDHLKNHKRIHTGEKPFKCDKCTLSFTQNGHLKRHKRIHTRDKPDKYDECTSIFFQTGNLKAHKGKASQM